MKAVTYNLVSLFFVHILLLFLIPQQLHAQQTAHSVPEGFMIIEGDIIVPKDFYAARAVWKPELWPNGIVYYEFDANVTSTNRELTLEAMQEWENVANVEFRVRANEANYVYIQNADKNSSLVGMWGGRQELNMVSWESKFIIVHELGHALGFWHEQTRSDRDNYVTINFGNVETNKNDNFDIAAPSLQDLYPKVQYGLGSGLDARGIGTYDFDSVMHYDQYAFSINHGVLPTIQVKSTVPNYLFWQNNMGQRDHLSALDQITMSFLYPPSTWRFVDQHHDGPEDGKFANPYKQVTSGVNGTPANGTLWIQPGTYSAAGTYSNPMVIKAPLGHVILQ